jgi:Tfp pilus assembly protein PilF
LHQAENLLSSALQIDAQNVNAKVLLGYVYAHQKLYTKAEALFAEAAGTDTKNLWLWANWGELRAMQGDLKGATTKYREAINRPLGHDTYDRARLDAFEKLLVIVRRSNDLDGMEALYKQRAEEFTECGCYTEYAKFLIQQRGDTSAAIAFTQKAIAAGQDAKEARKILGVAYYLNWANAAGDSRTEALNQARIYLPEGPTALYLLATSDRTVDAAKQLIRNGESIDQLDNEKLNALAYALERQDTAAVRRLLKLGARPDKLVGEDEMPVALIPVLSNDTAAIQVLQQFGVDYAKINYRGMNAFDYAKQISDDRLLKVLNHKGVTT